VGFGLAGCLPGLVDERCSAGDANDLEFSMLQDISQRLIFDDRIIDLHLMPHPL
jgi:hypothetical protein